jgi:hypothetical protein
VRIRESVESNDEEEFKRGAASDEFAIVRMHFDLWRVGESDGGAEE